MSARKILNARRASRAHSQLGDSAPAAAERLVRRNPAQTSCPPLSEVVLDRVTAPMILGSSARGHRPPGGFRCTCPPSPIENGGGLTGCPLIPTQARPPPRWGTTRGVWSTGARSPRALGTCDGHDLSVAPGRPPRSWPSPSPVRRPPPPGRRPPAPGSPPSEPAHHRHAVRRSVVGARRAPRARDHGVEPIALERDLSDSTPTARHAAAVAGDEDGGQVSRPRTVSPRPASTSAARPGDGALHEPHVPRPRPPASSCRAGR